MAKQEKKPAKGTDAGSAVEQDPLYHGVKKDPLDLRDLYYTGSLQELPLALDNRQRVPFLLHQGQEGACTGFGPAAVVNYLFANHSDLSRHPAKTVSARMLFEMAQRYDEWEGEDYDGSSIRGAMKGWHKHGVCLEEYWPYRANRPGSLTPQAQLDALGRPLGNYFRVRHHHLEHMHSALTEVGILYASAQVHRGWNQAGQSDGRIPFDEEAIGAHAFAIVGYDCDGFWIQNSWGEYWGLNGFCHLGYDDWLRNGLDCWVARLGVPTRSSTLTGKGGSGRASYFDYLPHQEVVLAEIRPHFVNLGNDGRFSESGLYSSSRREVETVIERQFTRQTAQWGAGRRLSLYAHGGLNNEKASASRIASLLPYFVANRVYPLHFMWQTGFGETMTGIVQDAFRRGPLQSWFGEEKAGLLDLLDEAIELGSRPIGQPVWGQMKQNAQSASRDRSGGARYVAQRIARYVKRRGPVELHLVGHSAGSIFHGHLVPLLIRLGLPIKSLTLFAPACSMNLFESNLLSFLGQGIERLTVFNLTDQAERQDKVGPLYRKSLLYLVSQAFETRRSRPLAGMNKFWAPESVARQRMGQPVFESERAVIYSRGGPRLRLASASKTHGGFDNDEETLNSMLRIMLGSNRLRKAFVPS